MYGIYIYIYGKYVANTWKNRWQIYGKYMVISMVISTLSTNSNNGYLTIDCYWILDDVDIVHQFDITT